MKRTKKGTLALLSLSLLLLGLAAAAARTAEAPRDVFGYPVNGEAWYSITAPFTPPPAAAAGSVCRIARVEVNKKRCRDFVPLQDGKEPPSGELRLDRPFEVKVRFGWRPATAYTVELTLEDVKSGKRIPFAWSGTSPAGKGYWDPSWQSYLSLILSEENGVARRGYPVHATVGVISSYVRSADEVRVVRADRRGGDVVYREVPSQVYDFVAWNDPKVLGIEEKDAQTGKPVLRYHPTTSFSVAFLADLEPRSKATYLVFFNNARAPKPVYKSDLTVRRGRLFGRTVENGFYRITLQEKSGVIYEIMEKTTGLKLEHKLETNGAVHWNPDIYAPPHAWYHSSDWSDPKADEVAGPVFYSLNLKGALPFPKGVDVGIRYHFYAGSPVVMVETVTEVENDMFVMALRNAEVVFNKAVFTKAAFKEGGAMEVLDLTRSKMHPAHAAVLRPDTPWVSFFDEAKGIGFASLYLDLATPNLNGGLASLAQPFIYIENGPWYYVSRGFVYSFATNNQTRMLPVRGGSVYYERNAWLAFPYPKGKTLASLLDGTYDMLKWPVAVREDMETFAESPEGWVVPILTEPFEEGVKSAVGGKDRRK
ncbi:MAG TPA: hypothetical protein VMS75_07980 [Terriglobales bacterium]|nr:hypothetical protein [Terriglobales bacterium]